MSVTPRFLQREDMRTRAWDNLIQDMDARLQDLRIENDSFSDRDTTAKRRGRIAELKEWLALAKQAQSSDAGPYGPASFQPHDAAFDSQPEP